MNEITPILKLYENMQAVLDNAALYSAEITHFSAGGLGACAYSDDISAGELDRCWQHEEYRITCPHCGEKSYITRWAGHVNGGGYWEIGLFLSTMQKGNKNPQTRSSSHSLDENEKHLTRRTKKINNDTKKEQ